MSEEQTETTETSAPSEAFTPMPDAEMIALALAYVAGGGTGKGIKKTELARFMQTIARAAESQPAPAAESQSQPVPVAPDTAEFDAALEARTAPLHARIAELEGEIGAIVDTLAAMPETTTGDMPAMPDGDHTFITSAVAVSATGTSLHVAKRANRDYSKREAVVLGLDILAKAQTLA